jgi:hypothetical protein
MKATGVPIAGAPEPAATLTPAMTPEEFVREVYARMARRRGPQPPLALEAIQNSDVYRNVMHNYPALLPSDREAPILDVGFGAGWFLAACIALGYRNLHGAEFGDKSHVRGWSPAIRRIDSITDLVGYLRSQREAYAFLHLSHLIEHIPKYSLLHLGDALYGALAPGGTLLLRTPNMEGPCAMSSLFVTLAHEYGFAGANLHSFLELCGFQDIRFHRFRLARPTWKQRAGAVARAALERWNGARHRLFGVNHGGQFGSELVVSARR